MKKSTLSILFILLSCLSLCAEQEIRVQARAGAFFPAVSRFTSIYGDCLPFYELEASTPFCNFDIFGNLDLVTKKGRSDSLHHYTRITIANISFGIKLPYQLRDDLSLYIGIGPSLGSVFVRNHIQGSHSKSTHFAYGGVIKTGFIYNITCNLFADFFFDYLYQSAFHNHLNIGGSKIGLGLGTTF